MITPNEQLPEAIKKYRRIGQFKTLVFILFFGYIFYGFWFESERLDSYFSYENIIVVATISSVLGLVQLLLLKNLAPEFMRIFYRQKGIIDQKNSLNPEMNIPPLVRIQKNLRLGLVFWFFACIPGLNFFAAPFLLFLLIYQKFQSDTKIIIAERRGFKLLIILATLALIPIIGTLFSIVGFIKCLLLINRYKAE